jgi:aconitate hydratase
MSPPLDPLGTLLKLDTATGVVSYYSLNKLGTDVSGLPFSIKILLESVLRHCDDDIVTVDDVRAASRWSPGMEHPPELPFLPARVLLQDFTGIPVIADLTAVRAEFARQGGDPTRVNPAISVDLVVDHSVQVDAFGLADAFRINVDREYERNGERYAFLRWAQRSFKNLSIVPPGAGIVHQVNLEFLARVVQTTNQNGDTIAFPDTVVGADSHTPMVNGIGVLGWGVGGIEAEAAMLGQPMPLVMPDVVGVRLSGSLNEGVTATDLVLTVTEMLRNHGVVGKFVEFCGPGLSSMSLPDRATISNMSPEYGATCGYFPIDGETLRYMRMTGRDEALVDLTEKYARAQGIFREDSTPDPQFTDLLTLDLATVEASVAGPSRPQDRVPLSGVRASLREAFADHFGDGVNAQRFDTEGGTVNEAQQPTEVAVEASPAPKAVSVTVGRETAELTHGSVVIAAITSCTNTSNPSVMLAAGLVAKKAVERGLSIPPYVKTSLAPGSRAVVDYLKRADLLPSLEQLRFNLVGFGCTTCIGNSGPLDDPVAKAVDENGLVVAAVLSGNRNFEGRIHPQVRASYLASPPLVVAYALAGDVDRDLTSEPIGEGNDGPVYLGDIWPTSDEVRAAVKQAVDADVFREAYAHIFDGEERWHALKVPEGALYEWDEGSTYFREPPFVHGVTSEVPPSSDIEGARVLAMVGDSVTTDHISPAGSIAADGPAGKYLIDHGVERRDFNSFGSRRANHEVMMRGTFANVRFRNELVPEKEGGYTLHFPEEDETTIFAAAVRYADEGVPLVVVAGTAYGTGSSRDWAAKGTQLLGVKAVIAESWERIHRSNLIGMGVLPLEFVPGQGRGSLGLTGRETFAIRGLNEIETGGTVTVQADDKHFKAKVRIDSELEMRQYRNGGILPLILRQLLGV